jgi:hemerythrin-like metal-binding protein
MDFIEWDDSFLTGFHEIDVQHRYLVRVINGVYDQYVTNREVKGFDDSIAELEKYALYHFRAEEQMMRASEFLYSQKHILEHQNFFLKVKFFKDRVQIEDTEVVIELINFLKEWLLNHVNGADRLYIETFRNFGFT